MKLETKRLILRKPKISDWKDIVEGIGDLEVSKNLSNVPYPYKKEDALWWIKKTIKKWNKKVQEDYSFMIELKSEKKAIGSLGIHNLDNFNKICTTGSWLNQKYHRKGYITEAKIVVNEFAFNKLKMRKMETGAFVDNKASNATQKSIGYEYEGLRKKHYLSKSTGKIHDENLYGLMKEDWKKNLPKLKKHLEEKIKKLDKKK
ncbi:GNAT family N-acetyltransferase [archaeon]|nr:GNAT family N-acetyltransferase [archaeon]